MKLAVLVLLAIMAVTTTAQQQVYDAGNGVTFPVLVKEVKPTYTPGAMAKKIQGSVLLKSVSWPMALLARWQLSNHSILNLTSKQSLRAVRISCELTFTLK